MSSLLGSEQTQEEFNQLLQYIYQNNGVGLILSPPLLGTSSRIKMAIEHLMSNLAKPMNPILTGAGDSKNHPNPTNEWQAALLKYKTVENPRISQQSATNIQDFKPIYIDLRSLQTRSEILITIANALGMETFPKLESLQEEFYYCLRGGDLCTLFIFDHVSKIATKFLYELFASLLETIGIIIIAEFRLDLSLIWQEQQLQTAAATPVGASTPYATPNSTPGVHFFGVGNTPSASDSSTFDEAVIAKAFIKEIQDFSSLLALSFEDNVDSLTTSSSIANGNSIDAKRFLIYSSTLSFRETFAVVKSLPATQNSAQTTKEETNDANPTTSNAPPISPKTDLILDIAKGIPGLILITHSLDTKILRSLQETKGKFSRTNTILSIKQIINRYILIGRSYSTIFHVYSEIIKNLSNLLTSSALQVLKQITRLLIKSQEKKSGRFGGKGHSILRTESASDEEIDDINNNDLEEEDILIEEMESFNIPNYYSLQKENSLIYHLKLMKKDLLQLGVTENDLLILQQLQILIPLFRGGDTGNGNHHNHVTDSILKKTLSKDQEEMHENSLKSAPVFDSSSFIAGVTDDYQLFSIPVYLLEMMKFQWTSDLAQVPPSPPPSAPSATANKLLLGDPTRFLSDGIITNHLTLLLSLFQEYSILQLLFTIPELQKYQCINENMILIKYQLNKDLFYLFHQLIQCLYPYLLRITLKMDSSVTTSFTCHTVLSSLLTKKSSFVNPLFAKTRAAPTVAKDEVKPLVLDDEFLHQSHEDEERMMLMVGLIILSFGEEMLEMWYPLQENIAFITVFTKILIRWKLKEIQGLVKHPFMQNLLASTFSPNSVASNHPVDYKLAFARIVQNAISTIFQLWKTYYWSSSWISSSTKYPTGNLGGSGSFNGNDILYSSINEVVLGALEKLLAVHGNVMDVIKEVIGVPASNAVSRSKSDDSAGRANATSGLPAAAVKAVTYQYYYLICKQMTLSTEISNITSITNLLKGARRSSQSITDIFPFILKEISNNTLSNIQSLQQSIEFFQKDYYQLSKLQMKIYLQEIIHKLINIMTTNQQQRAFSEEDIGGNTCISYSSDDWLKQRVFIIKIFESIAQTYQSSSFLLLSLVFRYFPAIVTSSSSSTTSNATASPAVPPSTTTGAMHSLARLSSMNIACKEMMPLIYSYHTNYLCTFQDKLLFFQSLLLSLHQKHQESLFKREDIVFYSQDEDFNYHNLLANEKEIKRVMSAVMEQEEEAKGRNHSEVDDDNDLSDLNDLNDPEKLYYTKEEQQLRQKIIQKQNILQYVLQYFTQSIEEYIAIYGNDCMLATKTIVYLSVINEIEYQFFNQNELDKILLQYYDKVLIENRNNCDLSLFHYRKLLLSSSSSSSSTLLVNNNINNNITATPQTSSSSIGKKAFPFSPRNTLSPTKSNNNIADEDTTPNNVNPSSTTVLALHYSNQNINEIKFMYSFLHYLLGKYNLFILEQNIRKSKNTKGENGETKKSKAIPKHIQETQQYITLALFQTGYETLLSIQRNEAGNALLMCLMIAQLELLGRTEKIDLFQQIMYHLVDSLNYERQYLQEKLLGMIRSLLFTKQHSNVTNPQYEDDTISVTSFGSIPVRKGFITPVGKSAAHGRTERSNPVSFIDSTIRATIRSGIELAFTLQQLLYHCAILYEERELYQQASLIYKELLYMYRDLHSLLTLDAVELFPLFSLYEYQQKEKKQQQQQQQRGGSGKKGNNPNMTNDEAEEEIAMLERLYDRMNQSIYYELLQLFEEISLSFPPIDVTIANMLFALGKSLCYYHLDPTVLGNNTMTPMNIPSGNNSNNSNNINANLYYHNLYKYYSLSHKIPTYYIMKDDRSTSHYLQYFQAIRALQTAKRLYHRIYSVNITSSLGGSGVGLSKSYSSASSDGGDDKGVSLSFLKTNSNDQMLARQYLRIYRELGRLYCSKKEFQKSRHCHQILQKLLLSVPGFLSLLEIADLQVEYGNILLHLNEFFEANIIFQQSIDYYRQYYIEQTLSNINIPPVSSNPMEGNGMHLPEGGESNDNERFTSQEEKALFQFIQKKFIISYLGKSSALLEDGDFDGAQKTIEYTIDLIYEFYQRKDDIYLIEITLAYMILASIHHYYHEYNEALELYNKIEKVYLQLHMIETVEMAKLYHNLAIVHDDMGKQKEAKVFYEKAVVLLIQRHSTQFQQLLTTLEGLHDLLMDMNLNEEAESIERYAEDLQQRIKKYDEEEELRIKTLQKSLKLQNNFLSNAEEWSYQQRRSVVKSSPVNVPNTSNTASGGRGGSPAGVPSSANSSPNLSHQFRKKYVSGRSSPGRRKSLGGGSSNGGDSAGSADEGKGGAGRGGYGPDPSAVLTKSDSFKKRLRASYYLKHKLSPSNKTLTPRSLRQVVIQTDGNPRPSIDPYYFEEEGDIEGLTYIDSPHSSSGSNPSFSRKNSAINNNTNNAPSTPMTTTAAAMSMFKQSFHFKKQETKPVAPPGAGLKSSFDIHRLFSDGVLFTSMDEADITVPGSAGGGGRRGRTESEERDDILEMGGQARHRGSGPRKHMSFGRDLNFYDEDEDEEEEEEGEYELDEEYGGEEDDDDEERTTSVTNANNNTNNNTTTAENLPSGNCIIQ